MSIFTHTVKFNKPVTFTDHTGVKFVNVTTNETAAPSLAAPLYLTDEPTGSQILSYNNVEWVTDPFVGDVIEWQYDADVIGANYQDPDAVLMADDTLRLQNCAVSSVVNGWTGGPDCTQTVYTPLENHPDWELVGGAVPTSTRWDAGDIHITGTTSPDQAIAFGQVNAADVTATCKLLFKSTDLTTPSFILCVRMTDANNFIGIRSYSNNLDVFERIGGAFNSLTTLVFPAGTEPEIGLTTNGNTVTIHREGLGDSNVITSLLTPGRVGVVCRTWTAGDVAVTKDYAAVSNE